MQQPFPFTALRDARTPALERLEFLTDVQTSCNGTEARSPQRARPRYFYSFDIVAGTAAGAECIAALRTGEIFLVPMYPHAFAHPQTVPDAGMVAGSDRVLALETSGGYVVVNGPISAEHQLAVPCWAGRPDKDERSVSHVAPGVARARVSFMLQDFKEDVPPYAGAWSEQVPAMPLLDAFTGAGGSLAEQVKVDANTHDAGSSVLYESRYMERSCSIQIVLNSRAQILQFRSLLFLLRGRLNPVRWTAPFDDTERTWRLSSDAVELSYVRGDVARVNLSLTQLPD